MNKDGTEKLIALQSFLIQTSPTSTLQENKLKWCRIAVFFSPVGPNSFET